MKAVLILLVLSISNLAFPESSMDNSISFTLHNSSPQPVPLKIPGVMNPNLSPFSDSEVTLEVGQVIYFKYEKKKQVLLKVGSKLDGTSVNVPELIKELIETLGLEREGFQLQEININ